MATYYLEVTNLDFSGDNNADPIMYRFQAIQNLDRLKEVGRTIASAETAEKSVSYNFSPPKVRIPLTWQMIDGENKSQLTEDKAYNPDTDTHTLETSGIGADDSRFTSTDSNGNYIVKTVEEQIAFLRSYVFNSTGGTKYVFHGGNFTWDWDGDGSTEGTPVSPENMRLPRNVQNLYNPEASIEMPIADVV